MQGRENTGKMIPGYEGYAVYEDGAVVNLETGKQLAPYQNNSGYLRVGLRKDGERQQAFVHRLVADAFVPNPNPEAWQQVNHINGDITDNRAVNLEWCDGDTNIMHREWLRKLKRTEGAQA